MNSKHFFSIFLQLTSIPTLYQVLYAIVLCFHEPYVPIGGDGMDFYVMTLGLLTWFVLLTLPLLNMLIYVLKMKFYLSILAHAVWMIFIVYHSFSDLKFHPYDYGLVLFCVASTIVTRPLIDYWLKINRKNESTSTN